MELGLDFLGQERAIHTGRERENNFIKASQWESYVIRGI